MPTLILYLPLSPGTNAPEYDYVVTQTGQAVQTHGRATASLLPVQGGRGTEVVAVVPARALSWHRVALPERVLRSVLSSRSEPARVRGILAGVLEEQLLDEPERLHFAVFAGAANGPSEAPEAWAAVCDKAWLQTSLHALELSGNAASRIVAECTPSQTGVPQALLSEDLQPAQMLLCTAQGVSLLPLSGASLAIAQAQSGLEVFAEPAVMALAQSSFGNQVTLQTRAQRLLLAAQSPWNLAQLEISASAGGRLQKRMAFAWQQLLHGAPWRPVRLGLLALLLVQVAALNALAWRQHNLQDAQRAAIQGVLQQTFPDVGLVIDAPLQMQRAVDDLARARGAGSTGDLGQVLSVLAPLAPNGLNLSAIESGGQQLRLDMPNLDPAQGSAMVAALQARGLRAKLQGGQLQVSAPETH